MRGLKVALLEKNDIASGTSSKTSKLAHGGIRYLEHFEFGLVREALRERATLLQNAPHLVRPLPFLFPSYQGDRRPPWMIAMGGFLYHKLAGKHQIGAWGFLTREAILEREAIQSKGLRGGILYYDAQMDDVRICIENAIAASEHGAMITTHCEVTGFTKEKGRITGVCVGNISIRTRSVVSATGPWGDTVAKLDNPKAMLLLRPTKGAHLISSIPLTREHAVVISSERDSRIMFTIPWRGGSLIGTTDTDFKGRPDDVHADREDFEYLFNEARRFFPNANLAQENIIGTFAGLRPTIRQVGKHPSSISREHIIRETKSGLIQLAGGKYTTARGVAEEVSDRVMQKLRIKNPVRCRTTSAPLPGGAGIDFIHAKESVRDIALGVGLSEEIVLNLIQTYGGRWMEIVELAKEEKRLSQRVCKHHPHILAQVVYGIRQEFAKTLSDVLSRRLQMSGLPCRGLDALENVGEVLANELGWDLATKNNEMESYRKEILADTPV